MLPCGCHCWVQAFSHSGPEMPKECYQFLILSVSGGWGHLCLYEPELSAIACSEDNQFLKE